MRMAESSFETQSRHYVIVARAIEFIRNNARQSTQPCRYCR